MSEPDREKAWAMCEAAMKPLEQLELEILRAERPPFDQWYRSTFIRHEQTGLNPHRPYLVLRAFLASDGKRTPQPPAKWQRSDAERFLPVLRESD
jgi:hypothetical protein